MSGLADVARLAGVSKSTASRALSGGGYVSLESRQRVEHAAHELGFVASSNAASLVTGITRNVGVVTPFLSRWFFSEAIEGIEAALVEAGYDLTLYRLSADADARRRVFDYFLVRKRVDAVIAVGIALTPNEVSMLRALGKPIVGIGGSIADIQTLSIDEGAATRDATEHLIRLGHTSIVHLGGDGDEQPDFSIQAQRLAGFREAMASAGLDAANDFCRSAFNIPAGYRCALDFLADAATRPTAIVAGCDEIAIGAIIAARELGIAVPQQLSVIGVDDHELSAMFGLTTLRQDPSAQGALAVSLVLTELQRQGEHDTKTDATPARSRTVAVTHIERSSTAPPAARALPQPVSGV